MPEALLRSLEPCTTKRVALPDGAMEKPNFVYATLAPTPSLTLTLTLTRLLRVRRSPELAPHARSSAS